MDPNERRIIDDLFGRLRQAEGRSGPRDGEAERLIQERLADQPAAPYYMAQAMLVQENAIASLQSRVRELESRAPSSSSGGFLSGLFGGGRDARPAPVPPRAYGGQGYGQHGYGGQQGHGYGQPSAHGQGYGGRDPWGGGGRFGGGGGGFMSGALQTAVGVAGGMLVADALTDAFSGGEEAVAGAAEGVSDFAADPAGAVGDHASDPGDPGAEQADFGGDGGGDFGEEI